MYMRQFGFRRYPFEPSLEADGLFASRALKEAGARLEHLVERRGIGLLTGEVGSGKTAACRRLAATLPRARYKVCYPALLAGSVRDACYALCDAFGLPRRGSRAVAHAAVRERVAAMVEENGRFPVLVVDEAHLLRDPVLEDLRLLCNYGMDADARLCMILVGVTPLRKRLELTAYESLAQRLVLRHQMAHLERDEVEPYLRHRIAAAGAPADLPLFEPAAVESLFLASAGVPRQLNHIAHYALCAAASEKADAATPEHVEKATREVAP